MEERPHKNSTTYILASLIVAACGWGILWAGASGIKLALNNAGLIEVTASSTSTNTASILDALLPPKTDFISILIGGDVMLDRAVRSIANQYGYDSLFSNVSSLFRSSDIVAVNLEGPITSNPSKTLLTNGKYSKELTFTFATSTAAALSDAGISIVSLANNHTTNFGTSGFKETKKWLDKADVKWFGSPWNSSSTESVIKKNNIAVAFVGYYAFEPGFDRVIQSVKELSSKGNFVIVMPHWGEEYSARSSNNMRSQAKLLADAGAGAIFGAHPHVVLDREWIGNVPVFYSLGNLLFDQYFSEKVMQGNLIDLQLTKDQSGTHIDKVSVYDTSTASRRGIDITDQPIDFSR